MPITINGTGTITGISAGGLPDGVITAAELDGAQSGSAPIYAARAWVNFTGTGTVAIKASGNVSSITDNGTGDYTVTFTTAMPNTNYAVTGAQRKGSADTRGTCFEIEPATALTTSAARVRTIVVNTSPAVVDCADVFVAVHR